MQKTIFWVLALVLLPGALWAQGKKSLSGYLTDQSSGEALIGANIYQAETQKGASSNVYGYYSVSFPEGKIRIKVSAIGYEGLALEIDLRADTVLNIALQPKAAQLAEVEVIAESEKDNVGSSRMGTVSLGAASIKSIPLILGEADVFKALQMLPGVKAGSEGSTDFFVRGGAPGQNLVLLDGAPVYNASHLLGFFSVFNPDAIKKVELIKGGFPARYGGRLSSVVDIQLKEGNKQEFKGEGAIGLLSSKLLLEGPLVKNKSSFMVSARRTYFDLFTSPLMKAFGGGNSTAYHFYDLNAKANYSFSPKNTLYLSVYSGQDKLNNRSVYVNGGTKSNTLFKLLWGNATSALRWNRVYGDKLFSNLTLTYSRYKFDVLGRTDETYASPAGFYNSEVGYLSDIEDFAAKLDFDHFVSNDHALKYGFNATSHAFKPNAISLGLESGGSVGAHASDTVFAAVPIRATEYYFYAEDDMNLSDRLKANVGAHFSGFAVEGKNYTSLQPRASLNYRLDGKTSLKASYARMAQYIHLLSNSSAGMPTDIWVPATARIAPQQSWQAAAGLTRNLEWRGQAFTLTAEGYYKDMRNVLEFTKGTDFLKNGPETNFAAEAGYDWQDRVAVGKGWSYGGELLLQKSSGKLTGWMGYTLAWSKRKFDEINLGKTFPYKYDQRHNASVVLAYRLNKRVGLSANWVYATGNAVTVAKSSYPVLEENSSGNPYNDRPEIIESLGERNNYRMPAYHRLDLGVDFTKKKKKYERVWAFSLYNAYSRRNPYYLSADSHKYLQAGVTARTATIVSIMPIPLPSVSYRFKF